MKYYVLKNASNANGWDMFPAGETIKYTINAETLSLPQGVEVGSMVIGYQSAPKDRFYSLFKVMNISNNSLLFEKEFEINGGIGISEVRDEVREHIESDYSGIFEIEKSDFESICDSMFINASTDFVGKPFGGTLKGKRLRTSSKLLPIFISPYLTALRTKPFMLLAGISGTGKSRIVRKLAQATTTQAYEKEEDRWKDNRPENFELIQVKPNWHNSMDVVGFYSNISKKYEFTPFVEFIVKAWQHKDTPYFLCLDEMNLAPVEEYFAEFLSAIESRSTDSEGNYITDPIIKPFKDFGKNDKGEDIGKNMLKHLFGEADPIDKNPLAVQFYEKGLTLPPNLMVMGTVNMDETTFSFSRKVLDRAMSVEMNEVDYDKFLSGETEAFPLLTDFNALLVNRPQKASEVKDDIDSTKVVEYLKDVNALLEDTPFKLGYRAANEAMLYVAANKELAGENFSLTTALDEFTLMKILSRIEGDDQRLGIDENDPRIAAAHITADTDGDPLSLLTCLRAIVRNHLGNDTQTKKKIASMCRTLDREHFVSYWG